MENDDIEIHHTDGSSILKGIPQSDIKELRKQVRESPTASGLIPFRGVKQIDILAPDGSPRQTIYGEPGEVGQEKNN